jgi:formate hydrogenlyase transcriptional activator
MSVNDTEMRVIGELLAATRKAHSPRALARTIEGALGTRMAMSAELRGVIEQVIAAASRHVEVVQRLAALTRAQTMHRAVGPAPAIIAHSAVMRAVMEQVDRVARYSTTVLVLGESGSGKEVVAREIHARSMRGHRPMLTVNCGALPDGLIESELFGHERGAFSGAERTHLGVFERAHRSTLFLDEIGELSSAAQAKLLRVLEDKRVMRVGGAEAIDVDVRVIAATNRSLQSMVEHGTFRADLWYRLDVVAIRVPPLRERLAAYHWPGNVRELRNVLERARIVGALDLPAVRSHGLDAAIRDAIESALRATAGKIYGRDGAAALLGLPPATLQSKMQKLGIERRRFT